MSELATLLDRRDGGYQPPAALRERVLERARQRRRNRRAGTALTVVLLAAVTVSGWSRLFPPADSVVFDQPSDRLAGTWVSTDLDGSAQTMEVRALDGGAFTVIVQDSDATVCSGGPSTMTGTGRVTSSELVVSTPVFTCDDGSAPKGLDPPVDEQLRNYTLVHDAETDTLTDSLAGYWRRPAADDPAASEPPQAGAMWPQSDLDEVREAQRRADAGDPGFTWQVDPALDAEGGIAGAAIFSRFLTEKLGWERFRYVSSGTDGVGLSSVERNGSIADSYQPTFARCAPDTPNPLYPDHPQGRSCAPSIGEFGYETVQVSIDQPIDTGPDGIWVVQGWHAGAPLRQAVSPSHRDVAELVETFLRARIDGQGAERHVTPAAEVPLLYETTTGARYDRIAYEAVMVWPTGVAEVTVRLFVDDGDTVVQQGFTMEDGQRVVEYSGQTTQDGEPVAKQYALLDGRVRFSAPAEPRFWQGAFGFAPGGIDWVGLQGQYLESGLSDFAVVVDPLPPAGACGVRDQPLSADELVRTVRSSPYLSVTAEDAQVGGIDAVRMDVAAGDKASGCSQPSNYGQSGAPVLAPRPGDAFPVAWYAVNRDNRARLYVFDLPGRQERTVTIVVLGPKSDFERVLEAAQPLIDSFQLTGDG